MDKIKLMPF